jgi:hypothetical protein
VELIFKSDYHLVDFLVDITMDTAKILVSSVVIGVVGGIMTLFSFPIVLTIGLIVIVGLILNNQLNKYDENLGLSASLKEKLRDFYLRYGENMLNNNLSSLPYLF